MALGKEDVIFLLRKSDNASTLWKESFDSLMERIDEVTADQLRELEQRQRQRRFYVEERPILAAALHEAMPGIKLPHGITRGGIIDMLIDIDAAAFTLDDDQRAIVDAWNSPKCIVCAGPGAGKTTTITRLAHRICIERPYARILVLAFNVAAEATIIERLRKMRVPIIPNNKLLMNDEYGVAVLTFNKYGYRILQEHGIPITMDKGKNGDYKPQLEQAAALISKYGTCAQWGWLLADESQDNQPVHASIINSVVSAIQYPSTPPRLFAFGDPRQELYPGCTWLSSIWKNAADEEKRVLRYNHRSHPEIVAVLNMFSRANFPTLHFDQVPTRHAGTRKNIVQIHEIHDVCQSWVYMGNSPDVKTSTNLLGSTAGKLLTPGNYAISPVTVGKFNMDLATASVRQTYFKRWEAAPLVGELANSSEEKDPAIISTSKKIKGTERQSVVVYGVDIDYSITVDDASYKKLVFVALSRARDELHIVMRNHAHPEAFRVMEPLLTSSKLVPAPARRESGLGALQTIYVSSSGGIMGVMENGLCSVEYIKPVVLDTIDVPSIEIKIENDADFVGVYAESLLANAIGCQLASSVRVESVDDKAQRGWSVNNNGEYVIREAKHKCAATRQLIQECIALCAGDRASAPYMHAMLRYSYLAGKCWTLSKRLARENKELLSQIATVAEVLHTYTNIMASTHSERRIVDIPHERSLGVLANGVVSFEMDFAVPLDEQKSTAAIPIEIKYVNVIKDEHRRQAAAYAALTGAPHAFLINLQDGKMEIIAALRRSELLEVARVMVALRDARSISIARGACLRDGLPHDLVQDCVIVFAVIVANDDDVPPGMVADGSNNLEIAAVGFSAVDWSIRGTFNKLAPGVVANDAAGGHGLQIEDPELWINSRDQFNKQFTDWCRDLAARRCVYSWPDIANMWRQWPRFDLAQPVTLGCAFENVIVAHSKNACFVRYRAFENVIAALSVFVAIHNFAGCT